MAITLEDLEKVRPYQLAALQHIHDTCEKHGLKYTLWGGTALGAVRHKGFIPWDADVDVALLRSDFEKLKKILLDQNEKKTGFYLCSRENYPRNYIRYHPILKVDGTYLDLKNNVDRNMHHGIFIDIFMLDYQPNNRFIIFVQKYLMHMLKKVGIAKRVSVDEIKNICSFFKTIFRNVLKMIPDWIFYKLFDLASSFAPKDGSRIISLVTGYTYEKMVFEREIFNNFELINFEDKKFLIISSYERYLTKLYGDYMKIPQKNDALYRSDLLDSLILK